MKQIFLLVILIGVLNANKSSAQLGWRWGKSSMPANDPGMSVSAAATDDSGNVLMAGSTGANTSPSTVYYLVYGTDTVYRNGRLNQHVVIKADSNGNFLWARGSQNASAVPIS